MYSVPAVTEKVKIVLRNYKRTVNTVKFRLNIRQLKPEI